MYNFIFISDVIHTVGPQDGSAKKLETCYKNCFAIQAEHKIKSIAFPCISTGIFGFPNRLAAHIALKAARKALEANEDLERVIFCTFMPIDVEIYETLMQMYFPLHEWNYNDGASVTEWGWWILKCETQVDWLLQFIIKFMAKLGLGTY